MNTAWRGLVCHSWPGGILGKSLELPKRQETFSCLFVSRCVRRGGSENHLNEFQRWSRASAINEDPKDEHEMLRLLLQPPRNLCASTGHYPHIPSWEPVQPTTAGVLWSRDNSQENIRCPSGWWNVMPASATTGLCHIPYPSLPLAWVSHSPLIRYYFNPVLSGMGTDALRRPTGKGRAKSKAEPKELCKERREREISPSNFRKNRLNLHNQLDRPASVEYMNRQRIIPNWGGGHWEQKYIYIFPFSLFECVGVCFCVWFWLYSFAFTICPKVLSVLIFFLVYSLQLVIIGGFVFWFGCSLLSFILSFF